MRAYKGIPIAADSAIHDSCLNLLQAVLKPGDRVLDIAAGFGAFSARLRDAGYAVVANDIREGEWPLADVPKLNCNLNLPLPEALKQAGPFHAVAAIEVIEHLENPRKLLRDCVDLLQPEGYIVLSTPNTVNAYSRLSFVRDATFHWLNPAEFHRSGHITVLPPWLLKLHFEWAGLEIVRSDFVGRNIAPYRSARGLIGRIAIRLLRPAMRHEMAGELTRNAVVYLLRRTRRPT